QTAMEPARLLAGKPAAATGLHQTGTRASRQPAAAGISTAARALPSSATIVYVVTMGQAGTPLGRAIHESRRNGSAYSSRAVTETSGLAALIQDSSISQTSVGTLGPEGWIPGEYGYDRSGKLTESAI